MMRRLTHHLLTHPITHPHDRSINLQNFSAQQLSLQGRPLARTYNDDGSAVKVANTSLLPVCRIYNRLVA